MFNPIAQSISLQRASERLEAARRQWELEKADTSTWTRLKDSLTHTPVEEEYDQAQIALSVLEGEIADTAPRWVESRILKLVEEAPHVESAPLRSLLPNLNLARQTNTKINQMRDLARTALEELRDAVLQCDAAAAGELMDAMSTLRPSRSIKDNETDEADYAVQRASSALFRLGTGIETAMSQVMGESGDGGAWWRKTLDFDVSGIAGLNLSSLGKTSDEIKQLLPHVQELATSLALASDRQEKLLSAQIAAYAAHEAPLRAKVLASLPENIQKFLLDRSLCVQPSFREIDPISHPQLVDLDILSKARAN